MAKAVFKLSSKIPAPASRACERLTSDVSVVAVIIGANDVVNPAGRDQKNSPIYGMPILNADKARTVSVIKRSLNPGFAGLDNSLFDQDNTVMVFGGAKAKVGELVAEIKQLWLDVSRRCHACGNAIEPIAGHCTT